MKNRLKKIKGYIPPIDSEYADETVFNPLMAALANPDLLSDEESQMFPERDFDEEQARVEYIEKYKKGLAKLTPKQMAIVEALGRLGDQQAVADELRIARVTVAVTLRKIQKKILKVVNKMQKGECKVKGEL